MATIKLTISAENAQAIAALKQVAGQAVQTGTAVKGAGDGAGSSFAGATKSAGSFIGTLGRVGIAATGVLLILREIKQAVVAIAGPGFKFNMDTETTELGMAGILQSMTLIDGKAVSFNQAMDISSDTMQKLRVDALRTAANIDDLRDAFLAAVAPGVRAGMTIDQIRQLTTVSVNAVKSLKVPAQQTIQEIRDLMQGGITAAGSTLATALGITDADIERAKNSSEGLFKFLMDRLRGFEETSKRFPDTMRGRLDQLNEYFTMTSAKFAEGFEEPIKDGLQDISDMIGRVNEETGQFEVNPAILEFIEEVNAGYRETKELVVDIKQITNGIFDPAANSASNLYGITKDLISVLADLGRVSVKVSMPGLKLLGEELDREIARVRWLTDQAKTLFDYWARLSGAKNLNGNTSTVSAGLSPADLQRSEDTNLLPTIGALTSKFPDMKKVVEDSQAALKVALSAIAADAKKAITEIKREQENIEVLYKQSLISTEEYTKRKVALEMKAQQVAVDEAQRKLEAIQAAVYNKDSEKQVATDKANEELSIEVEKLKAFGIGLDDVTKAIGNMSGVSNTWRKEVEGVDVKGLQDNAKAAIDALSAYFYKQTGQQMVVSSGQRDWGGHVSGTKFDVVDDSASRLLEDNVNGIREKIVTYAREIGLQVLDEYDNPSEKATGGHLDINAKDFTATMAEQARVRIGQVLTKSGLEYLNAIIALMEKSDDIIKSLAESKGDVSGRQKAELAAKYNELIKTFQANGMSGAVKNVQELQKSEFLKLDFAQAQQDLELANGQLTTAQEDLLNEMATGAKTAAEATDEYVLQYRAKTDKIVAELQRIIKEADANGDVGRSNQARALLRQIVKTVNYFADAVIARIDAELQNEISRINADRSLTRLQRQNAIDAVTRQAAAKRVAGLEDEAQRLRDIDKVNKNNNNAETIIKLEQAANLNRELAKTPSLLEDIREAGKQGLEDGLIDFLERGVIECRNLGDAFRNLAITVLQSIQKVYAEAMTKNIMGLLGLGTTRMSGSSAWSSGVEGPWRPDGSFADGGSMVDSGMVTGPGTSTSDSILAWVGNLKKWIRIANGEFVMRGAAVKKYGQGFLERLNSGQVPTGMLQKYAAGGSLLGGAALAGNVPGPQDIAANLSGDTTIPLSIMNILDPALMERALKTYSGKKAVLNIIKDEIGTIRQMIKIKG